MSQAWKLQGIYPISKLSQFYPFCSKMGYNNNAEDALNDAIEYILKKDSKDINIQSKSHLINTIKQKFGNVMTDYSYCIRNI